MASRGMICIPSLMDIGRGIQKIERFAPEIWKGVILVLLVGGIYKVRNSNRLGQNLSSSMTIGSGI
jgi:hypothetical protein